MAKSKASIILLSIAAIAIWGIVGYRVYRWVLPEDIPAGTPSMPMPERPMPAIAYKGLIRDADGCVKAMITYNNQTDGYRKGETIEGIKIKQITAECITVRWNGSDYTIAAK